MRRLGWRNGAENTKLFDSPTRQLGFVIYFVIYFEKYQIVGLAHKTSGIYYLFCLKSDNGIFEYLHAITNW